MAMTPECIHGHPRKGNTYFYIDKRGYFRYRCIICHRLATANSIKLRYRRDRTFREKIKLAYRNWYARHKSKDRRNASV